MKGKINLNDISIRTKLKPGDIGFITYLHGINYHEEQNHGISFEAYVASGLIEFYNNYDINKDRIWICEHNGKIIGTMMLIHRKGNTAQLRYFFIEKVYRGIGLGKKLMVLLMDFFQEGGYKSCYLWTTNELNTAASLYKRHGFILTEEKESIAFGKPLFEQRYDLINSK